MKIKKFLKLIVMSMMTYYVTKVSNWLAIYFWSIHPSSPQVGNINRLIMNKKKLCEGILIRFPAASDTREMKTENKKLQKTLLIRVIHQT